MDKEITRTAAIFGALAVIFGAFGAHSLKAVLTAQQLQIWQTGVQYQFYHVFALLFLSFIPGVKSKLASAAYYLFSLGIVLFSGSLYLLSCREAFGWYSLSPKLLGPVTPLGGLCFIAGWVMLILATYKKQ